MVTTQDPSTSTQLQVLQGQEASLVKQLSGAEASLKSYEKELSAMSSTERELNVLVRQNRSEKVVALRGQLDALRQKIGDVRAGVSDDWEQAIARVRPQEAVIERIREPARAPRRVVTPLP